MDNIRITYDLIKAREFFINKISFTIGPVELNYWIETKKNIQIVDVRTLSDYMEGHIPGAIHLDDEKIEDGLKFLEKDKITIIYCYNILCQLAAKCAIKVIENGFRSMELEGGFKEWQRYHYEIEK